MSDGDRPRASPTELHRPQPPPQPPPQLPPESRDDHKEKPKDQPHHGDQPSHHSTVSQKVQPQSHHSRSSPLLARTTSGARGGAKGRGTRSSNMIVDLLEEDAESPQRGVPKWLVEEQRHHQRRPQPELQANHPVQRHVTDSGKHQTTDTAFKEENSNSKEHVEEEYIMLDLLDAKHLPSKNIGSSQDAPNSQPSGTMSPSTDSIISLPPMEERTGQIRWHKLKAEAQEARKKARQASLTGRASRPPVPLQAHGKSPSIDLGDPVQGHDALFDEPSSGSLPCQSSPAIPSVSASSDSRLISKPLRAADIAHPEHVSDVSKGMPGSKRDEDVDTVSPQSIQSDSSSKLPPKGEVDRRAPVSKSKGNNYGLLINCDVGSSTEKVQHETNPCAKKPDRDDHSTDLFQAESHPPSISTGLTSRARGALASKPASGTDEGITARIPRSRNMSLQDVSESPLRKLFSRQGVEDDIDVSVSGTRSHGATSKGGRHGNRRKRRRDKSETVYPHSWEWRRPADEDVIIPNGAWVYLALIGWCSFAFAWLVNISSGFLSIEVTGFAAHVGSSLFGERGKIIFLAAIRALFLVLSFLIVSKISPKCTSGSGIPEMKCVLSGVYMPHALGFRTLIAKLVGLVFALASSISIGRLGPFIHISGICAALIARVPPFGVLASSARFQLQAVSCAMAAGVGATFGAPIGGTMLSIELMSTYYFIHWLPMALYCSIMGYYLISAFSPTDAQAYFYASVSIGLKNQSLYKLATFAILGALCGLVGSMLVQYTIFMFKLRRRYLRPDMKIASSIALAVFAATHSLVLSNFGGVLEAGQRAGVISLFNDKAAGDTTKWMKHSVNFFVNSEWNASFALFVAMIVKFCLTGMALVLPVPAGTFMPIFEIGALLGRSFGEFWSRFSFVTWVDPRATAIVGAAGVAAGTLHITSIAVVMLEITREAVDILPLALGVIVAYGVSKHLCSDLFSELMKIRRMPFILGLRERYPRENKLFHQRVAAVSAGTFMLRDFPFVTPDSTIGEVRKLLSVSTSAGPWSTCAFLNNDKERHLWGTITRPVLLDIISTLTTSLNAVDVVSGSPTIRPKDSDSAFRSTDLSGEERLSLLGGSRPPDSSAARGSDKDGQEVRVDTTYGSVGQHSLVFDAGENERVPFLVEYDPRRGSRLVDMGPMQVSTETPFWKVSTYFRMLGLSSMYVTDNGATVGLLTKARVISFTFRIEDEAAEESAQKEREDREVADFVALGRGASPSSGRAASRGASSRIASRFSEQDLQQMVASRRSRNPNSFSSHQR